MTPPEKSKSKRLRMVKSAAEDGKTGETAPVQNSRVIDNTTCARCFGTGLEMVPGEGARRCDCQMSDHRERLFQSARIPARYQHCTLANYDAGNSESLWIAKREAQVVLISRWDPCALKERSEEHTSELQSQSNLVCR